MTRQAGELVAGRLVAVEVVCLDPHEGYRKAVRRLKAEGVLGEKTRVAADPSPLKRVEPVNSVCEDVVSLHEKKQSGIDISSEIANLAEDYDGL